MYKFKQSDIGKKFYLSGYVIPGQDITKGLAIDIVSNRVYGSVDEQLKSVVASDASNDRHGESVSAEGWILTEFKRNSVMLWAHDNRIPAIGTWKNPRFEERGKSKALVMDPQFDRNQGDALADLIAGKVERGVIVAVSVGFMPLEFDRNFNSIKHELLEVSWVNIGANRNALNENDTKPKKAINLQPLFEEYLLDKHGLNK